MNILYIEDNADLSYVFSTLLTTKIPTAKISIATTGMGGLELFKKGLQGTIDSFDVVIADVLLADTSGIKVLQDIITLSPTMAVLLLTAYADESFVQKSGIEVFSKMNVLKLIEHLTQLSL